MSDRRCAPGASSLPQIAAIGLAVTNSLAIFSPAASARLSRSSDR